MKRDKEKDPDLKEEIEGIETEIKKAPLEKKGIIAMGIDVGTMNLLCARSDNNEVKLIRNVFLPLKSDEVDISELSDINYVTSEDNDLYIIGDDAQKLANIFGKTVSRPMQKGLISSDEISSTDVLAIMIKTLIGDIKDKDVYCSYSIPAQAIDEGRSVTYHEKVFGRIFANLGINYKPINEAMAIIYSECANDGFSGIAISFGAGMSNLVVSYRGIEAVTFSTARSGDWIDKNVAESLNMVQNRVTSIKEKNLNLQENYTKEPNKKIRRVLEALHYYYENLIEYTVKRMVEEFESNLKIEIEDPIPIIISGGTSLPKGFLELFIEIMKRYTLSFEISEIRQAKNPLTAVANGLLIKTISDVGSKK